MGIRNGQQYTTRFTNNIDKLANTYTVNKSSIFGWKIDTTLDMRLNGKSSTSSVGNPSVYGSHLTIGYGTYTNGAYFPGDIQEVIRYNAGLSATEIQKVESYLAVKYGITLDQTSPRDYLSSNGSVIWSASTAGSYNKDITAIGRDDDSSLNQKQSTSINGDILTIGYTTIASSNGANPNAFPSNNAFLSRANNGGAVNVWTQTGAPNIRKILPKVWKLQSNLSLFTGVAVQIDATTLPQETELIYLLMDDDGDFSNGGTVEVPLTPNTSLRGATTDVDSTKPYITFATEAISPGGVSTSLVQWSKADNAGCVPGSTCSSWKDLSSYLRNVTTQ
ncbi:hypothetical protein FACS1894176_01280 [Bacteroidia bacterium]|nr:hypothetical protein FACS1894176_01280 [Bacteroidia bacterium]